jgi:hypothetical protein
VPGGGRPRSGAPYRCATTPRLDGLTETEIVTELYVLAHEVGHFLSWLRGQDGDAQMRAVDAELRAALIRRDEIFSAVADANPEASNNELTCLVNTQLQQELTGAQRRLIFDEEQCAWALGRALLVEFGLADLEPYEARAEASLRTYREELGVD